MATQMGFAYSQTIKGVGAFGSSFYFCAEEDEKNIGSQCINTKFKDLEHITQNIEYLEDNGYIDKTGNLSTSKVFLFNGREDTEIPVGMGKLSELVWKKYTQNIKSNFSIDSEHNMVTDFYGWKC